MNTRRLGILLALGVLSLACSEDEPGQQNPDGSQAGQSTGGMAGTGGSGGSLEGEGGAPAGPPEIGAEARHELCETVCATEAELPCPPDPQVCMAVWCEDPVTFFPHCLGFYDVMLACLAEESVDDFECFEGEPLPKEETCAEEHAALLSCLEG